MVSINYPHIINVKVISNAKKEEIILEDNSHLKVKLSIVPEKGKANKRLIELLSEYFNVSKSRLRIVSGEFNKNKIISIDS
ncbi:MAG: hypothetical protein A2Y40_10475 [Candidatus Margulisbacteria bacterium GWF2_35_9]|nr:MAG: hypothetical protein A2Y40_10475 [Candidatus Margulisbacteria bacterium GWF2_35_9]